MGNKNLIGAILCGGASSRMGFNKGLISYHGLPQKEHAFKLVDTLCQETFYAVGPLQQTTGLDLPDKPEYMGNGPIAGLLSVFDHRPNKNLLVLGCDYPLVTSKHLTQLIEAFEGRDSAVCFASGQDSLPEPLIALYGSSFLEEIKTSFLKNGSSSLRKLLMNPKVKYLLASNEAELMSADTPEKMEEAKRLLSQI